MGAPVPRVPLTMPSSSAHLKLQTISCGMLRVDAVGLRCRCRRRCSDGRGESDAFSVDTATEASAFRTREHFLVLSQKCEAL
jgi:hypothetical protein